MVVVCCELTHFETISLGFGEMVFVYLWVLWWWREHCKISAPKKRVQSVCRGSSIEGGDSEIILHFSTDFSFFSRFPLLFAFCAQNMPRRQS